MPAQRVAQFIPAQRPSSRPCGGRVGFGAKQEAHPRRLFELIEEKSHARRVQVGGGNGDVGRTLSVFRMPARSRLISFATASPRSGRLVAKTGGKRAPGSETGVVAHPPSSSRRSTRWRQFRKCCRTWAYRSE